VSRPERIFHSNMQNRRLDIFFKFKMSKRQNVKKYLLSFSIITVRNPSSRSQIVGFFGKRKERKAVSFCSTPIHTGVYSSGRVSRYFVK
jgi:hypothetical protein